MSHSYYQNLWNEAQNDLRKNLTFEEKIRKKGPYANLETAKWLISHLFINYVRIVNKLDSCYDQIIHPQKREVLSRLLDMALGRLLEVKSELVRIEYDDYCFFDNALIELKLTHEDVEITVPKYFLRDREKAKNHRRELMREVFKQAEQQAFKNEFLKNVAPANKEEVWQNYLEDQKQQLLEKEKFEEQQKKVLEITSKPLSSIEKLKKELRKEIELSDEEKQALRNAVILIQRHERARQGRIHALLIRKSKASKRKEEPLKMEEVKYHNAARVIQRHWKRYKMRAQEAKVQDHINKLLGATPPSFREVNAYKKMEHAIKFRRKLQEKNQQMYEEAMEKMKEKVKALYSIPMEEDTVDEIRGWFMWFFEKSNYLPDYPPEKPRMPTENLYGVPKKLGPDFAAKVFGFKKIPGLPKSPLAMALSGIKPIGGTALVVGGYWVGPEEYLICKRELEKSKGGKALSKADKAALKKKKREEEKRKQQAEDSVGFQLRNSDFLFPLNTGDRDYRVFWMNRDESQNFNQEHIPELVKEEKCHELSMEVRKIVDEMMRLELEDLKFALHKDKFPKKKGKKKRPKPKREKKKKKKKKPDMTEDRTLDDLFMELFENGIIRDYEDVYLKDYLGEKSFGAFDFREKNIEWPPSTGDVKDLILQLCILPLGSARIHYLGPLIKSVCLLGAENSGKEFLARIICTETAAVMFDLSPTNVAGKYPGKDGLKMLKHLIEKMSRALQPSILFVDGAEKMFYKKVPKDEKPLEPKRLAKTLGKIVKNIKPTDQILMLGVSSAPWMARKRKFVKQFQKLIFVPQMDYGSYFRLWKALLANYSSVPKDFDVSCLAKVSGGFSVAAIMTTVKNVMTIKRISVSKIRPFKPLEFLEELLKQHPTDEKLLKKNLKFYKKTDMQKKRAKKLTQAREDKERLNRKK